jgi:DNA-binding response OmpR family regulator
MLEVQTRRIDIVLLDLLMPGVHGWEVFERLRQIRGQRPKVIFLTGVDSSIAAVAALKLGAEDWIVKPFDEDVLRQQIRSLAQRHRMHVREGSSAGGQLSPCCSRSSTASSWSTARPLREPPPVMAPPWTSGLALSQTSRHCAADRCSICRSTE